ncbi:Ppx/GppA phosphatase family protein, partial [Glycomyces tenuis]
MRRVAGIDCGTNSIRLLIADIDGDGRLHDVVRRMEVVRLGEGVDDTGRLSAAALERTRAALADYTARIREHGAEAVRMVATSATRDAANAHEFTAMVTSVLGAAPEVISGDEEARLSFTGAAATLPEPAGQRLLVDIGGGSTEFVRGSGSEVLAAISVDVGCVRMTERHLRSDPPAVSEVDAAAADIRAIVDA